MSQWWSDDGATADDRPTVGTSEPPGSGPVPPPPMAPAQQSHLPPPPQQLSPPPLAPGGHHVPAPGVVPPATAGIGPEAAPGSAPGRRPRVALVLGGALALIAVLAGAWVAYGFFNRGGAASPEAAVEALASSLESQDPALAASVLNPAETRLLADLVDEVGSARGRVDAGSNGSSVGGTRIEVKDLRLRSEELGPRLARVTIRSADVEVAATRSGLPPAVRTAAFEMDEGEVRWNLDVNDVAGDVSVIVVEDGGWYVSPALTVADHVVADRAESDGFEADPDYDDFGEVDTFDEGAETPGEAIDLLADAISSGDPRDMVAALPSDQGQFGVVYGDALETILTTSIDTSVMMDGWLSLDDVDVEEEDGPDGTTRLLIRSATVADNSSGDVWVVDGVDVCAGGSDCDNSWSSDGSALRRLVEESLGGSLSLIARPVDGGWKIDPVASILDMATRVVRSADADVVRSLLRSTSGDPTATAQVGQTSEVELSTEGYALVEVATTPGADYALHVGSDDGSSVPVNVGTVGTAVEVDELWTDSGTVHRFTADSESTRIALGGLDESATSARLTVGEITTVDAALSQEVQGTLSGPLALYRVPVDSVSADAAGVRRLMLSAVASGGDVTMEVVDDAGDDSWEIYGDDIVVDEEATTATRSVETATALVAVIGDPGAGYSFRLDPDLRGFTGGQLVGRVTVPGQTSIQVPLDLGSSETGVEVLVEWTASADIDGVLLIGGAREDSDTAVRFGGDFTLGGTGSGAGAVELRNLSSVPVDVDLELTLDP